MFGVSSGFGFRVEPFTETKGCGCRLAVFRDTRGSGLNHPERPALGHKVR